MKGFRKWNVRMLIMVLLVGVLAVSGQVQAAGKKNASDVAALNAMIRKQRAAGATIPTDLNARCYKWNSKGRLTGIYWGGENDWGKAPKLKGSLSFSKFSALEGLAVSGGVTSLNVKNNKQLKGLDCGDCKLTKLDVSKNKKLTILNCYGNKLKKLDVSKNKNLKELYCFDNKLTKLNVSKCTKLRLIQCENNKLAKLDVSTNTKLKVLSCDNNKLTGLDLTKNKKLESLYCKKNKITVIDVTNCSRDISVECDKKVLVLEDEHGDVHTLKEMIKERKKAGDKVPENLADSRYTWNKSGELTGIDWSGLGLTRFVSFKRLSALTSIDVSNNNLINIVVTGNPELISLDCRNNNITRLNLRNNSKLTNLYCDDTVEIIR